MKTFIPAVLASFVAVAAHAQSSVPSVNAAGYIKVTCEPNKFQFVQNPFNSFDGSENTLADIIGDALPSLSLLYVWDATGQEYLPFTYVQGIGLLDKNGAPSEGPLMPRGRGFFIVTPTPSPGQPAVADVFLFGEVPGATSNQSTQMPAQTGFNAVGFPYPVQRLLSETGLDTATEHLDLAYLFNPQTQSYEGSTRLVVPGLNMKWDNDFVVPPGGVVFVLKNGAQSTFTCTVPYSWPNN